jgi:hypothetical protein
VEPDARKTARAPTKLEVTITSELSGVVRGTVEDVGTGGLFVVCRERLPVGSLCELALRMTSDEGDVYLEAAGRVAHVEPEGMGIQIVELDFDHYELLRRLVSGPTG